MLTANFYTKKLDQTESYGKFLLEPLPLSLGNSLGNALRRTLLSSLEGAAMTQVKVSGVSHLFSTLKGVKESALEVVLNIQQLRFEPAGQKSFKISIEEKGAKKIYGKDVKSEAKISNKDFYIAQITDDKTKLEVEAIVEVGVGIRSRDEIEKKEAGFIGLDAYFSPVKKVNFKVEEARVGRKTNFDRLILEIWTDGTVLPEEVLKKSSTILTDHFGHILSGKDVLKPKEESLEKEEKEKEIDQKLKDIIIDELNLPSRVINALLRENIETIADLVKVGKDKLINIKGLGKKSFVLIEDELKKIGVDINS